MIHSIEDSQGRVLYSDQEIGNKAIRIFQNQFQEINFNQDFGMLDCIPNLISELDSVDMERWPEKEETRLAVF